ncbi:glycosyltransferase [Clostridium estertheticum]|uniref:glycosyltransferase n=1 Tax=Clostridium estertheticum TaxID=238834 RepID=UPI001C0C83C6|nr:glycosyltransferase [Clostridium estertheticum]MBU3198072.1 glycosyltransferase [Clostridium estertheticum]WAG65866.1 glycosyltransferase [Clostridium estertheticum]
MLKQVAGGNNVTLLYPGHFTIDKKLRIDENKSFKGVKVYEILNPIGIPLLSGIPSPETYFKNRDINVYIDFLKESKVKILHIHTLMGLDKELVAAAKELNIKTIFTSHDYFGICPKVNLIDLQGEICEEYHNGENCITCNRNGYSSSLVFFMQSRTYRYLKNSRIIKKLRAYKQKLIIKKNHELTETELINEEKNNKNNPSASGYVRFRKNSIDILNNIDFIHYNSSVAKNTYERYLNNVNSRVLNISHSNIKDNRIKKQSNSKEPLKITYIGSIEKYKGLYFLLDVLRQLLKNNISEWNLNVYGKNVNINIDEFMGKVNIKGTYVYSDLEELFKNTDVLIVPSIWYETFGYIALEAFSYAVPVILTDLVGFKDMIKSGTTGIVIKAAEDELYKNLGAIIEDREKLSYINNNILNLASIYTMEKHASDIMELYSGLIKE